MKILISGGHITPALALIEYIQETSSEIEITFAGRKYSQTKQKQQSWEEIEIAKKNVTFVPFEAPKLITSSLADILSIVFTFPKSVIDALGIMLQQKPSVFVSFGSYQAVPLSLAAWLMRVPIVTHEQTKTIGVATKAIAPFAKKIAVSFKETVTELPKTKVVVTGNLIRRNLLNKTFDKPEWLKTTSRKPVLYVTGGNQGSEIINTTVGQVLSRLTKRWLVVHQCGNATAVRNYRSELEQLRNKLPPSQKSSYIIKEWLSEEELAWVYKQARVIVSRAGANTIQELQHYAIPSILIPLPFSRKDEQLIGAESLSKKGAAYLLHQKDLNPQSLVEALEVVEAQHSDMEEQLKKLPIKLDADKKLFDLIAQVAQQ